MTPVRHVMSVFREGQQTAEVQPRAKNIIIKMGGTKEKEGSVCNSSIITNAGQFPLIFPTSFSSFPLLFRRAVINLERP